MTLRSAARFWTAPVLWRFGLGSRGGSKAPEDWRTPRRWRADAGSWAQSANFRLVEFSPHAPLPLGEGWSEGECHLASKVRRWLRANLGQRQISFDTWLAT